jgi:alkyl sulfatase BDS1-like metallo-beta-lactamase superfamily hydrolase
MGWNTGDSTWFDPVSQQVRGIRIVEGFGGLNKTIDNVKQAFTKGEYSWAAELATHILNANPDSEEARLLKAQALRDIGEQEQAIGARNWYLTQANVLDGTINKSSITNLSKTNLLEEIASKIPASTILSQMQYKLDPMKSNDTYITFGIYLNDTNEGYTLQISNSVVHYTKSFPETYDVAITTDEKTLKDILLGKLRFVDAVESDRVTVYGNPADLIELVKSFDLKFIVPVFKDSVG